MDVAKEPCWDLAKKRMYFIWKIAGKAVKTLLIACDNCQQFYTLFVLWGRGVGRYVLFSPRLQGKDKRKGADREHALGELTKVRTQQTISHWWKNFRPACSAIS
jgi:hypothetical protein